MTEQRSPRRHGPAATLLRLARPRINAGQLVVGALCAMLGFAVVTQVDAVRSATPISAARQDDLVALLDDLTQREDRLRADIAALERTKAELERDEGGAAALEETRRRAVTYGILAGRLPARGPGIVLTVADPAGRVGPGHLLDAVQELRDAGAEVVQLNQVRIVVNTAFADAPGRGLLVGGAPVSPPYRFLVIGEPRTLATALDIPGGVLESLRGAGARGRVEVREKIIITAVHQ